MNVKKNTQKVVTQKSGRQKQRKSLVLSFSIKLGFCIAAAFIIMSFISTRNVSKSTNNTYHDIMKSILPSFADSAGLWTQQFIHEVHMYSQSDIVKTGTEEDIISWFRSINTRRAKDFDHVIFCGKDGIAYDDLNGTGKDIRDRAYYKTIMEDGKDVCIGDPVRSRTLNGVPVFFTCVAAYNNKNEKIGFFAGVLTLQHLQEKIEQTKIGQQGYLAIIDSRGVLISHPDKTFLMQDMTQSKDPETVQIIKQMIEGITGFGYINSIKGERSVVFYTPIPDTQWSAMVVIPKSQINLITHELTKSIIVQSIIFAILLLLIAAVMILHALKPLGGVEHSVYEIATGNADLTQRIPETVHNEIGSVVSGFNLFLVKLHEIISGVKESKNELATAGTDLQARIEDTSCAITQIISDMDDVNSEITNQSASVEETAGTMTEITQNIVSLEKMIENQASGITEASAAVEQMIGNIGSVDQSVEKMVTSFKKLEERTKNGIDRQQHVNEQIELISGQSETLEGANTVIADIANQTNLLAMNAAIEAAHAGDAGKGFSVVSDEIRKLSETSSSQSKKIGEELKKIKNSISSVVIESTELRTEFTSVSEKIMETDNLISQIKNAMSEQMDGSKQIGEALHMMKDSTVEVRTASSEMSSGQKSILEEVKRLQDATSSMKGKVVEMSTGTRKINETGTALGDISKKVGEAINRIGSQIDQFKV